MSAVTLRYTAQMARSRTAAKTECRKYLKVMAEEIGRRIGPVTFVKEWAVDLGTMKFYYCEATAKLK
jgi:hypothetical protein